MAHAMMEHVQFLNRPKNVAFQLDKLEYFNTFPRMISEMEKNMKKIALVIGLLISAVPMATQAQRLEVGLQKNWTYFEMNFDSLVAGLGDKKLIVETNQLVFGLTKINEKFLHSIDFGLGLGKSRVEDDEILGGYLIKADFAIDGEFSLKYKLGFRLWDVSAVYGSIGYVNYSTAATVNLQPSFDNIVISISNEKKDYSGFSYGLGAELTVWDNWVALAEYSHAKIKRDATFSDVRLNTDSPKASLGLLYRF